MPVDEITKESLELEKLRAEIVNLKFKKRVWSIKFVITTFAPLITAVLSAIFILNSQLWTDYQLKMDIEKNQFSKDTTAYKDTLRELHNKVFKLRLDSIRLDNAYQYMDSVNNAYKKNASKTVQELSAETFDLKTQLSSRPDSIQIKNLVAQLRRARDSINTTAIFFMNQIGFFGRSVDARLQQYPIRSAKDQEGFNEWFDLAVRRLQ